MEVSTSLIRNDNCNTPKVYLGARVYSGPHLTSSQFSINHTLHAKDRQLNGLTPRASNG